MTNGAWIKLSVGWDEDERVATLPDVAQLLWLKVLTRAKRQRPGGAFGSLAHLKALLPDRYHRHIGTLLSSGLLAQDDAGRIVVSAWAKHQIDPTVNDRSKRFRDARNGFATPMQRLDKENDKENDKEKEKDIFKNKNTMQRVGVILGVE